MEKHVGDARRTSTADDDHRSSKYLKKSQWTDNYEIFISSFLSLSPRVSAQRRVQSRDSVWYIEAGRM